MAVDSEVEPGLRERKRIATRVAIQRAAVELVLDRGIGVTVEEISHRAEVSPRTFFNYFPTKEDALLGLMPPLPTGEERDRFVTAGPKSDLIDDLARMFSVVGGDRVPDSEVYQLRRQLLARYPELAARRLLTTRTLESELLGIIEDRLANDARILGTTLAAVPQTARLVTFASFGVLRSAWMLWVDRDGAVPMDECVMSAFAEARALFGTK